MPYKGSTKVYILHTKTQKGLIKWRETTKRTPTEFIQSIELIIDKEETPVHALTYFGKKATNMQWGRLLCLPWYNPQFYFIFNNKGTGTFYGLALRTLHGDPNFRVLTTPQQPTPSKFKVSSMVRFELKTIHHLLGLHFSVFALTNWATTLVGPNKIHNYWNFMSNLFCISVSLYGLLYIFYKRFKPIIFSSFNELCSCEALV